MRQCAAAGPTWTHCLVPVWWGVIWGANLVLLPFTLVAERRWGLSFVLALLYHFQTYASSAIDSGGSGGC